MINHIENYNPLKAQLKKMQNIMILDSSFRQCTITNIIYISLATGKNCQILDSNLIRYAFKDHK